MASRPAYGKQKNTEHNIFTGRRNLGQETALKLVAHCEKEEKFNPICIHGINITFHHSSMYWHHMNKTHMAPSEETPT
jgi:hypothetical protein